MNWAGSTFGTFRTLVCSNTILHKQYIRNCLKEPEQRQMKWQRKFSQEAYIVTYTSVLVFVSPGPSLFSYMSRTSWHHWLGFVCFSHRLPSLSNSMVARLPLSANHLAALFLNVIFIVTIISQCCCWLYSPPPHQHPASRFINPISTSWLV